VRGVRGAVARARRVNAPGGARNAESLGACIGARCSDEHLYGSALPVDQPSFPNAIRRGLQPRRREASPAECTSAPSWLSSPWASPPAVATSTRAQPSA
jgi:hypothetical protein